MSEPELRSSSDLDPTERTAESVRDTWGSLPAAAGDGSYAPAGGEAWSEVWEYLSKH